MMKNRTKAILAIGAMAIAIMFFALPYGISAESPSANMTVYLTDLTAGQQSEASLTLGQPANSASVFKPSATFEPLTFTQGQTITAIPGNSYAFSFQADFKYDGTNIASWNTANVVFSATTPHGIVGGSYKIMNEANKATNGQTTVNYGGTSGGLPTSGTIVSLSSPSADKFRYVAFATPTVGLLYLNLLGSDLNNAQLKVVITVTGTDVNGQAVTAMVDGILTLTVGGTGAEPGSITLTINSMSASLG